MFLCLNFIFRLDIIIKWPNDGFLKCLIDRATNFPLFLSENLTQKVLDSVWSVQNQSFPVKCKGGDSSVLPCTPLAALYRQGKIMKLKQGNVCCISAGRRMRFAQVEKTSAVMVWPISQGLNPGPSMLFTCRRWPSPRQSRVPSAILCTSELQLKVCFFMPLF